jgi:hypothetical protein
MTLFHSIVISQNSAFAVYTPETSRTAAKLTGLEQCKEPVLPSVRCYAKLLVAYLHNNFKIRLRHQEVFL